MSDTIEEGGGDDVEKMLRDIGTMWKLDWGACLSIVQTQVARNGILAPLCTSEADKAEGWDGMDRPSRLLTAKSRWLGMAKCH